MKRIATDPAPSMPAGTVSNWEARLSLGFEDDAGTTRLTERTHFGPLRVQKPLYPEGERVCHAIVLHPPGGVVGGDQLAISARVGAAAAAFITTPGAAKWYKANGRVSRQNVHLDIGAGASLEWLPQETIFFDAAHVRLDNTIVLARDASYIGCDILCFGRTASGESFACGQIEQRTSIRHDGKLVWFEQGALAGGGASMTSPLALGGKTVCATLVAVGRTVPPAVIQALRDAGSDAFGVTQMKSVVVARYLGDSSETAKKLMTQAWQCLRPAMTGRAAMVPRIWNT